MGLKAVATLVPGGGAPVGGSGTPGKLAKFATASSIGDSLLSESGTTITSAATAETFGSAQTWTLATGTSALKIQSGLLNLDTTNSRVGIGTASPTHKLQAVGELGLYNAGVDAVYGDVLFMGAAAYQTTFRHKIKASISATATSSLMTFSLTSGASTFIDVMTLRGDGNVGIGTTSPLWKNHTVGVGALFSGSAYNLAAVSQDQSTYRGISFGYDSSGQIGTIAATTGGAGSSLAFWTYSGAVWGERMRIDSSGNVGIGTASPSSLGTNYTTLDIRGSAGGGIRAGTPSIMSYMYADASGWNVATSTALPIIFYTNNTERARIDSSGNLILNTVNTGATIQAAGTSQGLKLPATPGNADTQTLDCYAEGTWTPTLSGGATWGGTAPTANFANYTRVGRLIFFEIELIPTAATAFSATWGLSSFTLPVSAPRSTAIACNRNAASANAVTSSANLLLPTFGLSAENLRISGVYAV